MKNQPQKWLAFFDVKVLQLPYTRNAQRCEAEKMGDETPTNLSVK